MDWLIKFPNLKILDIVNHQGFENHHFDQIYQILEHLSVINFHLCCRLTLRILIPLFKITGLQKLMIDYESFWCQKGPRELFIHPDEWKSMTVLQLDSLAINSENMTLDVIDYILGACPTLKHLIVNDIVVTEIGQQLKESFEPHKLKITSWSDPTRGLEFKYRPKFRQMHKDAYGQTMFSKSMMNMIKKRHGENYMGDVESTGDLTIHS